MSYRETYEHLAINGVTCKEDVQLLYNVRNVEKLRKELQKRNL